MAVAAWILSAYFGAGARVPTMVVRRGPFERRVTAEGNLKASDSTPVTTPVDAQGQFKVAWLIPDGTPVKRGDVVVKFDPSEMERTLRDGESERTTAESRITGMRSDSGGAIRNLERDAALAREELKGSDQFHVDDPDVFSHQEIIRSQLDRKLANQRIATSDAVRSIKADVAKVDLDLLDIERRKAGMAIDRAKKGLQALEIRAPHDGILVYERDWRGDITKVGDTVWPGESVAEIPNLNTMEARVYVLEADAGGLAAGLPASVVIEAHPTVPYRSKIKKVDTLAARRNGWLPVQYFGVTLEFEATDPAVMKPGSRVRAVIDLDVRAEAISIPRNAVFEVHGSPVVYKRSGRSFRAVPVTLGPAAVGRVVVDQGLTAGDEIALSDPTAAAGSSAPATAPGRTATARPSVQ